MRSTPQRVRLLLRLLLPEHEAAAAFRAVLLPLAVQVTVGIPRPAGSCSRLQLKVKLQLPQTALSFHLSIVSDHYQGNCDWKSTWKVTHSATVLGARCVYMCTTNVNAHRYAYENRFGL